MKAIKYPLLDSLVENTGLASQCVVSGHRSMTEP